MRYLLVGVYFVVAISLAAPTCLGDDAAIARKVAEKLRFQQEQKALSGFHITVKVEDGTVWMLGDVADTEQRDLALDAARRIKDVRLVVNDLDVESEIVASRSASSSSLAENKRLQNGGRQDEGTTTDQSFVRQAAAIAHVGSSSPVSRQVSPQVSRNPVGMGVNAGPRAPIHVAQLQDGAACYGGTCDTGSVGGGIVDGGYYGGYSDGGYADGGYSAGGYSAGGYSGGEYSDGGFVYDGGGQGVSSGQPQMPNYAWPAYASYPNYGAVTYPKQYSPSAWPYIGPFHPYPQVPLGWRKVSLEWDDGWWMLDFSSK